MSGSYTRVFTVLIFLFPLLSFQVLIAVLPQVQTQYFDVEVKTWKPLASTTPSIEATQCHYATSAGNKLYVAGSAGFDHYIYRYDTEGNAWEKQPHSCGQINSLCIIDDYMYAISSDCNQVPQRYSFSKGQWQTFAELIITGDYKLFRSYFSGATVLQSKVYVLYGTNLFSGGWRVQNAGLHCFDPVKNKWEQKPTTCKPHFESCLFVVNSKLYVAGGYDSIAPNGTLQGNPGSVEVYDEEKSTWSVLEQQHIPPNKLGAVEIEGKVYFIINKFPVDSGIRIPPGELYPVHLGEWENLAKIANTAVLCNLPVKRESLKSE